MPSRGAMILLLTHGAPEKRAPEMGRACCHMVRWSLRHGVLLKHLKACCAVLCCVSVIDRVWTSGVGAGRTRLCRCILIGLSSCSMVQHGAGCVQLCLVVFSCACACISKGLVSTHGEVFL